MSISPAATDRDRPRPHAASFASATKPLPRHAATWAFCAVACAVPLLPALASSANAQAFLGAIGFVAVLGLAACDELTTRIRPFVPTEAGLAIGLSTIAALITTLVHRAPPVSILAAMPYFAMLASFVAARLTLRQRADGHRLALALALPVSILSAFGLLGYYRFQTAVVAGMAEESARSAWLSTPFYPHSYITAQVIAPLVPLLLAQWIARPRRWSGYFLTLALALAVPFLLLTLSRAIWLALAVSTALVVATAARRWIASRGRKNWFATRQLHTLAAIPIVAGGLLLVFAPRPPWIEAAIESARDRITSLLDPTVAAFNFSRIQVWSDSLGVAADNQPFGVGIGRFAAELAARDEGRRFIPHAHNQFVQYFTETGLLGLAGFCWLLFGAIALGRRALAATDAKGIDAPPLRGALGGLLVFAIVCWFETPLLHVPCAATFGFLAAIVVESAARARVAPVVRGDVGPESTGRAFARLPKLSIAAITGIAVCFGLQVLAVTKGRDAQNALLRGNTAEAARLADSATRLQPQIEWLWWLAAEARLAAGDLEAAVAAYERYSALVPRVPTVSLAHAKALSRLNRHDEAIALLIDARRRAPLELVIDVDYHLANTFTWVGRDEEARILYLGLVYRHATAKFDDLGRRFMACLERLGRDQERLSMAQLFNGAPRGADTPPSAPPR